MSAIRLAKVHENSKGTLGSIFIVAIAIIAMTLGTLAVDFMHMLAVKEQLQNATDAGALAGAQDLSFHLADAEADALAVTAKNRADGRLVSGSSSGTKVTCKVTAPQIQNNTSGEVEVTASMEIRHLLAPLFWRNVDTITATSAAGTAGELGVLNAGQAFPLAVSIDAVPENNSVKGIALRNLKPGDSLTIYIASQQVKNGCFTTFKYSPSANKLRSLLAQALDLAEKIPGFVPSVQVGDPIQLDNGVSGQKVLADDLFLSAMKAKGLLILPVIEGEPPFSQTGKVVGFVGLRVTTIESNGKNGIVEAINGRIELPQVSGESGPVTNTGFNLGPVQLIR